MFILRAVIHMLYTDAVAIIELIQLPKQHCIQIDDYVFLRPQQSEAVLPQFEAVYAYQHGQFTPWATFRE